MPERADPRELELIGFVRSGYATHVEKAISSRKPRWLTGPGRLDHLYHLLAIAEALGWVRLGEAIGYFREGSAERLWDRTDSQVKEFYFSGLTASMLSRVGSRVDWTPIQMIIRQGLSGPFSDMPPQDKSSEHEWLWVRTQLLLAQQFGSARAVRGFLAALVGYSDNEWNRRLEILARGVKGRSRERILDRLIATLRETASNDEGNIGVFGPSHFGLLAGFFRTIDHVAVVCDHSTGDHPSGMANAAGAVRCARLNFASDEVCRRFLAIADLASLVCEEARSRLNGEGAAPEDDFPSPQRRLELMSIWSGRRHVHAGSAGEQLSLRGHSDRS